MNIDVSIEVIDNGYIVTGNDSTKSKRYFSSIESFVTSEILEAAKGIDREMKRFEESKQPFSFKLTTDL
jgi:hypothetical protein